MKIYVSIKPSSKASSVEKAGDEYTVRVKEPVVDGKANQALVKLVAQYFNVPKTHVNIVRGATSRRKTIEIDGL